MRFWPGHVRSRLTLWYVLVLASLLAFYAGGAALFLFLSLREEQDRNLVKDLDDVEGLLATELDGSVSLHLKHGVGDEPRVGHFIEVWSPTGSLLFGVRHSENKLWASLQSQANSRGIRFLGRWF